MSPTRTPLPSALLLLASACALALLGPQRATLIPALVPWGLAWAALVHLWLRHQDWLSRPVILLGGALLLRAIFWVPLPDLSDDLFRYVWDGLLTLDGLRPYPLAPSDPALAHLHDTELFRELNSPDYTSIYPPLSQWLFVPGAAAYQAWGWPAAAWVVKGTFLLAETLGVLLLFATLRLLRRPVAPLALYAWNPLVLLTVAGGGHTEGALVLAIGLLLLGLVPLTRTPLAIGPILAWTGWGLAVLSKGLPILLAPLVWRATGLPTPSRHRNATIAQGVSRPDRWREGWRRLLVPAGVLLLMGTVSLPLLRPSDVPAIIGSARLYTALFEFNAGLYYSLKAALELLPGVGPARLGAVMGGVAVAGGLLVALRHRVDSVPGVASAAVLVFSLYLVLATTVHPWYLLWLLPFLAFTDTLRPAWLWASAAALPTYLTYTGVPHGPLVALFWGGWLLFAFHQYREWLFRPLRRVAARRKARWIAPHLVGSRWVDVGGGEGDVATAILREHPDTRARVPDTRARVMVADPMRLPPTRIPRIRGVGEALPLADGSVDSVVLSFVLHHAADPDRVLTEALRVVRESGGRVVILESAPRTRLGSWALERVDRWVNEKRGDGSMGKSSSRGRLMDPQAVIQYRRPDEWADAATRRGARVVRMDHPNRLGHPVTRLVLERP